MGKVVGFELSSKHPEKAAAFYEAVFGWETGEPVWDYREVKTGQGAAEITGGISKGPEDFPHGTRIQIEVDSIDQTLTDAKRNGAVIVREKMEFDDFYLAYATDPAGIGFGLIERKNSLQKGD
ncbi:VOC family protein [Metabacillus indicus]|uniref:VOC family protein n=1 Tax=Metabacillus indicus TaxID=246786 RepID=UPI003CF65F15